MPDQNDFLNNHQTSDFQKNTTYLQKVADLSPNILIVIDLHKRKIVYVNNRVNEILGYDSNYIYEKGADIFKVILHPDDYDRRLKSLEKSKNLSDHEENEIEIRFRTKNDGWEWFKLTEKVFEREHDGSVSKLISTAQNIHKQKLWEEKLREEHRRFRNAQEIGHIGDFDRELPGDIIHCSNEFFRIHGREPVPQGISLQEFVSYVHPDEQEVLWAAINGTHATGKPLDLVTRIVRPDGEIRNVHRRSAIIKDESGTPAKVYGTVQDITERVKAEEERKKSESLMRATETVAKTGSYEVDLVTGQAHLSDGFFRLFGEERDSFVPTIEMIDSRSHPEDVEKIHQTLDRAIENKEPYTYTRRIYRNNSEMRILQVQGNVITDKNGSAGKLIGLVQDITERKQSEQELLRLKDELAQRAKDRYRKIINSMDDGFCLLEAIFNEADECIDYRFLDKNPKFEEQTGLNNPVGKRISELISIEPYWTKFFGKVAKTGEALRLEHNVDGIGRWIEGYAFRVGAPKERQVAFIFKNITERKKAEERQAFFIEFNDALQPLAEPIEIQTIAMRMLAKHLNVIRANFAEVLEDGETLITSPGFFKEVSPLPQQLKISDFDPEIVKIFNRGESLIIADTLQHYERLEELRTAFEDIEVRACIAVPVVRNGKLLAVVAVHQSEPRQWKPEEIKLIEEMCERLWPAVEQARIEKALRESEQRFRNLVEASALAVWETNPEGIVETDSPSWRAFTGQTFEEWKGIGWLNAIHPNDREFVNKKWKETISSKSNVNMEFRVKTANGGYQWINVKATPILNTEGKIVKWSGMNLDIHDRKQAEEALRKAKEEAEAASRAKDDFVSTMSHEIRTPLNAVIGFTNLLLEQNPRKDQRESLKSLSFSAENLLTLINEILDFSKLEAGKVKLAENQFDLHDLLVSLKEAHKPQALANDTHLELQLDDSIPRRIVTDQLKLSQVLHNLVSNAVKFTEEGHVTISVSLNDQDEDMFWLDFSIQDTGIGIAADKLDHIFAKFSQAEHSNLHNHRGTGLGLSITKLLLDLMGSEIQVKSKIGEGSQFYFCLPVKMATREIPEDEPAVDIQEEIADLSHLHLLLVEDVEINREIVLQFLENWWQLMPDIAINGKEAVEMAKKHQYDLILMDVRMPVMDGYEATKQIRDLPEYASTPIVALTADRNQEVEQAENATQFTDLLTKPFKPQDLKQRIIQHLLVSKKKQVKETPGKPETTFLEEEFQPGSKPEPSGRRVQEKNNDPPFNISRYTKMAGDNQDVLLKWINSSILAFETYKKEFISAARDKSKKELSDLVHKNTSSVYYIQANALAKNIEEYRTLLKEAKVTERKLEKQKLYVLKEFDEVIEGLGSLKKEYELKN